MARARKPLTAARLLGWCVALTAGLVVCLGLALAVGVDEDGVSWSLGGEDSWTDLDRTILFRLRLPRILLAALLGGSLTVAGVVFQALLRNPLADPYVLGVSGGASIGGVVAVLLGLGSVGIPGVSGVPVLAFLGALGALVLIERIATVDGRLTVYTILLTGAIFNAFSAALIYFLQSVASLEQLHSIVFYLMGHVDAEGGYASVALVAVLAVIAFVVLLAMARDYNALSLGEEGAAQLGVDVERIKRRSFVLGSLLTGLAVAVAGLIGFVGLVVPHILRLLFGPDHRLLIPAGFLGGASFLVLADLLARTVVAPGEIPVGVVTALIGGPFFLYLLRRRRSNHGFG